MRGHVNNKTRRIAVSISVEEGRQFVDHYHNLVRSDYDLEQVEENLFQVLDRVLAQHERDEHVAQDVKHTRKKEPIL